MNKTLSDSTPTLASEEKQCPLTTFYTYNKDLDDKEIMIHQRVKDWYIRQGTECAAIIKQNYLSPDSIRNDTLEATMRRDHLTQEEAIQKIIFQHQLPASLIRAILTYGHIICQEDDEMTVYARVRTEVNTIFNYYYAEVTGKLCNDHIKIWHTFLRATSPQNYVEKLLSTTTSCLWNDDAFDSLTQKEKLLHTIQDLEEGFFPLLKSDDHVTEFMSYIKIVSQEKIFILFKE